MQNFGNNEIIQVAEAVAREKGIRFDKVLSALEEAIKIAARKKYGNDLSVRVSIDPHTGEVKIYREMVIVADEVNEDSIENTESENASDLVNSNNSEVSENSGLAKIKLSQAKLKNLNAAIGDILHEDLPPLDLNRLSALVAKNIIISKIKEVEREKQFEEFKDKVGEIVHGVVDKVEFGNVLVKIGNSAEAIIKKEGLLPTDRYKHGDRIKSYLTKIDPNAKGPQLILSRTDKNFVVKLFYHEVPEMYDGIIKIMGIARDPGSRSKIAVYSADPSIDAIGSTVGIRGSRVQAVIHELQGEKIDIIQWSEDIAQFTINALAPVEVLKIIIDENRNKIEIVVEDDQQSVVIGRGGQNVKLISELLGMDITILTKEREAKRRNDELRRIIDLFVKNLDLEEILAQLLASEGYTSISLLAKASVEALMKIQGLDEEIAKELIERAKEFQKERMIMLMEKLNLTEELATLLVQNNYYDVITISRAPYKELEAMPGIDREIAVELVAVAKDVLRSEEGLDDKSALRSEIDLRHNEDVKNKINDKKDIAEDIAVAQDVNANKDKDLAFVPADIRDFFIAAGLTSAAVIADLDNYEIGEILAGQGCSCDITILNSIIMNAREIAWKK